MFRLFLWPQKRWFLDKLQIFFPNLWMIASKTPAGAYDLVVPLEF